MSFKGRKFSEEHKNKISESNKGKIPWNKGIKMSKEFCKKISESMNGQKRSLGYIHTEESKNKMSESHKVENLSLESRNNISNGQKGKKMSRESRKKMSESKKGSKGPGWKGGITPINDLIRKCAEYKEWRTKVYTRDNYTCKICGETKSGSFNAHHILSFSKFPKERFNVDNGQTLCKKCHIIVTANLRKEYFEVINS